MDRKPYKTPFRKNSVTKFVCPTCTKGNLKVKENSFLHQETRSSRLAHSHDAWDPDWIVYVYSCLFECTNSACKEVVSSTGTGFVDQDFYYDENGNPDVNYDDYFRPVYFEPHLCFFSIPKATPDSVTDEVNTSFSLIFSDPASSSNHVRIALEHLLTFLKIKRFNTKNGKRLYLNLHQRIDLLPQKYDHVKDLFFTVKWLGNAGSHSGQEVTIDDVFDSYELLSEILSEVFENKRESAKSLAKRINKKKGPK